MTPTLRRPDLIAACAETAPPGYALELGVGKGTSLRIIAHHRPGQTYGFDSFQGLPEAWRPHFPAGTFACQPPDIPGATILAGPFDATLPIWTREHSTRDIGLIHIDCDLYSSTQLALSYLHDLQPGTILLFDELIGGRDYPEWPWHEHRALLEWVADTGHYLQPFGTVPGGEQAAFTIAEEPE